MKILIIEDKRGVAKALNNILKGYGDITLWTCLSPEQRKKDEVIKLIKLSDVILLDNELGTDYTGQDLYPHCEGKKVIGIASEVDFGTPFNMGYKVAFSGDIQMIQQFNDFFAKVITD
jgi:response regulator of citrate/malate metabolism